MRMTTLLGRGELPRRLYREKSNGQREAALCTVHLPGITDPDGCRQTFLPAIHDPTRIKRPFLRLYLKVCSDTTMSWPLRCSGYARPCIEMEVYRVSSSCFARILVYLDYCSVREVTRYRMHLPSILVLPHRSWVYWEWLNLTPRVLYPVFHLCLLQPSTWAIDPVSLRQKLHRRPDHGRCNAEAVMNIPWYCQVLSLLPTPF